MGCSRGHKCHQFLGNLTYLYCNNIFYESNASVISLRDNLNPNLKELNFSLCKELAKKHGFDLSSLLEKLLKIGILLLDGFALKLPQFAHSRSQGEMVNMGCAYENNDLGPTYERRIIVDNEQIIDKAKDLVEGWCWDVVVEFAAQWRLEKKSEGVMSVEAAIDGSSPKLEDMMAVDMCSEGYHNSGCAGGYGSLDIKRVAVI
ncbi:Uncharacterized protein Fot_36040 [Forsythia ovata]|uniref:Uncharacterized protein n=1 Tax=Forsythia ovata TaxID=205694 RepID=A0ABD1SR92_9LAMI